MIRRLWRWLIEDDRADLLHESARGLAAEMRRLDDKERHALWARHPYVWWHINRVTACVETEAGDEGLLAGGLLDAAGLLRPVEDV